MDWNKNTTPGQRTGIRRSLPDPMRKRIEDFLAQGDEARAIKVYRDSTASDLRSAVDAVRDINRLRRIVPV